MILRACKTASIHQQWTLTCAYDDSDVSTTMLSVKLGCIQKFRRYGCHGDETLDP